MNDSEVDLGKLAIDRSSAVKGAIRAHRRRWVTRYAVPLAILVGFAGLLGSAARQQWTRKHTVTVVPVIVKRASTQQPGTPLFQAAGWIEPRPTSVSVAALTPGVIEDLIVVEGQRVGKGEPVAHLIAVDAELQVELAQASLALREGELQRAKAEQTAAAIRFERPVHLHAELADAKSLFAKATTEKAKLPFLVKSAKASAAFTKTSLENKREAQQAVAGVVVEQAVMDHAAATAELEELQQRGANLQREIDAMQDKVDALSEQLTLLVDEKRQLDEAAAKVASAVAHRDEARLHLRRAKLNLDRTVVRAPIDGRVLRLVAPPGTRVMGLGVSGHQSSSTVVEMYDPNRLQVRADVRLEDVPLVSPGAPVQIQTASSAQPFPGRVLRTTSAANIQKNTLEVKVELLDPPMTVAPEMLVTATFMAAESSSVASVTDRRERLFISKGLLNSDGGNPSVWVVDADHLARRRYVKVGGPGPDGLVEIVDGLDATDKLIASGIDGLRDGDGTIISGEDPSMGAGR